MGRAGRGSSGGGSRSSGGGSRSRSSGGHRIGSSSSRRAGQGMSFSSSSRPSGYGSPGSYHRPPSPRPPRYHGSYRRTVYRSTPSGPVGILSTIFTFIIAIIIILFAMRSVSGGSMGSIPASTQNREKLTGTSYNNSCIVDELGWVENQSKLSRELQYFFDKTGIQPYIYIKGYDSSLNSDDAKTTYAENYYENNIGNEHTFLFMYFSEPNENDVGYMCYVNGYQVTSVMDSEAIDIFWAYIDKYWYSDMSTVDMFDKVFESTADRIMDKSTTMADVGMGAVIIIGIVVVSVILIVAVVIKRKHAREEAAETEAILNAPIESLSDSSGDDLLDKYTD